MPEVIAEELPDEDEEVALVDLTEAVGRGTIEVTPFTVSNVEPEGAESVEPPLELTAVPRDGLVELVPPEPDGVPAVVPDEFEPYVLGVNTPPEGMPLLALILEMVFAYVACPWPVMPPVNFSPFRLLWQFQISFRIVRLPCVSSLLASTHNHLHNNASRHPSEYLSLLCNKG